MNTSFKHDEIFSRAGGVVYLEIKNEIMIAMIIRKNKY